MITKLWLYPPLAIARVGTSSTPCEAFHWGPNDNLPRGTGKTTILPAESLWVDASGDVTTSTPTRIVFKDKTGFRPVCPFFELHGEWHIGEYTHRGPITPQVLTSLSLQRSDLTWSVCFANLKAYHHTLQMGDRIEACETLKGDVTASRPLKGRSPATEECLLVPKEKYVPLGHVQLTNPKPSEVFRLRFTPAKGLVYGPSNFIERKKEIEGKSNEWDWARLTLPPERLILNPNATWCHFNPTTKHDPRTAPDGVFVAAGSGEPGNPPLESLGLVDDVGDGIIRCRVRDGPIAAARIVVGPPDYAPDRRPVISMADGLKDRFEGHLPPEVYAALIESESDLASRELRDLFERIAENVGLTHLDFQNQRAGRLNRRIAREQQRTDLANRDLRPFTDLALEGTSRLPLTERGHQRHRRFLSLEVLEDTLREHPRLIDEIVRDPTDTSPYFDRRMPALLRGSDGAPLVLTRRQIGLLKAWVQHLRQSVEPTT